MIHISKGAVNELIVTVTEKTTIENPVYLFVFDFKLGNQQVAFILPDTSLHTSRYNQFTFTEGGAKTLQVGTHYYRIFAQTSAVNINPDLADEEVERGIARVKGTENTFISNVVNQTFKQNVL